MLETKRQILHTIYTKEIVQYNQSASLCDLDRTSFPTKNSLSMRNLVIILKREK